MDVLNRVLRLVFVVTVFGGGVMAGRYVWPRATHSASAESCKPVACTPVPAVPHAEKQKPAETKPAPRAEPEEEEMYCEPKLRGQKEPYCYPKSWREEEKKSEQKPGKPATEKPAPKVEKMAAVPVAEPEEARDPDADAAKFQEQNEATISKFRAKFKKDVGIDVLEPGENPPTEFACDSRAVDDMTKFAEIFRKSPLNTNQPYFQENIDKFEKIIFWLKQCIAEP